MRESYAIIYQIRDPDTPTYMEVLSSEHVDKYYKAMDDEIILLIRRETWEIFPRNLVADHKVLPVTWFFKIARRKPDCTINKFKT